MSTTTIKDNKITHNQSKKVVTVVTIKLIQYKSNKPCLSDPAQGPAHIH